MTRLYLRPVFCPLGLSLLCLLTMLLSDPGQASLEYQRQAILEGELWRLISGHLTHLNPAHLVMNLAGLWLIWWLFLTRQPLYPTCLLEMPALLAGTSLALLLFSPQLDWYRGLSGMLHGLLILALLRQLAQRSMSAALLLVLVCVKLLWEQTGGPLPGSESWISGRVIVDSHLYGAICGGLIWLFEYGRSLLNKHEVTG